MVTMLQYNCAYAILSKFYGSTQLAGLPAALYPQPKKIFSLHNHAAFASDIPVISHGRRC
jgi:hypothetical protein